MTIKKVLLLGAMAAGITACGSDDESNGTFGAPYSGSEEAATLSEDNKDVFAAGVTAYVANAEALEAGDDLAFNIAYEVNSLTRQQLETDTEERSAVGIVVSFDEQSECGGGYSGSADVTEKAIDEMTLETTIDIDAQFNSYCVGQIGPESFGLLDGGVDGLVKVLSNDSRPNIDLTLTNLSFTEVDSSENVQYTATLSGQVVYLVEEETETATYDLNVNVNGEARSVSYARYPSEEGYIESEGFKGENGKVYQYMYDLDGFLFEPELGKVGMYDDISECGMSEAPRLIEESPSEEVAEETAAEGYEGTVYLEDENYNLVEVNFGGTEEQPCSFEPTSVVFTPASQLM